MLTKFSIIDDREIKFKGRVNGRINITESWKESEDSFKMYGKHLSIQLRKNIIKFRYEHINSMMIQIDDPESVKSLQNCFLEFFDRL